MRMQGRGLAATAALVLLVASPASAQSAEVRFGGEVYDVTGAGRLDLGSIDAVLKPFRREFRRFDGLSFTMTVDAAGAVTDCTPEAAEEHPAAAEALCEHALEAGRFHRDPRLVLDYTRATYRLRLFARAEDRLPATGFYESSAYPLSETSVHFGEPALPPEDRRLSQADLVAAGLMDYPQAALQNEIAAQVVAVLTFDEAGAVASCRPVFSSRTARMAYETCLAAARTYRLRQAPDARPFVLSVRWLIAGG